MREPCPKCAGPLRSQQINHVQAKYCDRCGALPFAFDWSNDKPVIVGRSGELLNSAEVA